MISAILYGIILLQAFHYFMSEFSFFTAQHALQIYNEPYRVSKRHTVSEDNRDSSNHPVSVWVMTAFYQVATLIVLDTVHMFLLGSLSESQLALVEFPDFCSSLKSTTTSLGIISASALIMLDIVTDVLIVTRANFHTWCGKVSECLCRINSWPEICMLRQTSVSRQALGLAFIDLNVVRSFDCSTFSRRRPMLSLRIQPLTDCE